MLLKLYKILSIIPGITWKDWYKHDNFFPGCRESNRVLAEYKSRA
jgi:hypothetical protein